MIKTRYIFITGGVVSSLGKGLACAAIATILKAQGYHVRCKKLDPYLNVDPGTMNPTQHGEIFVTSDGAEADLDLGHYERFTDQNSSINDTISQGKIYEQIIKSERQGEYLGQTIQIIPHVTDKIKNFIISENEAYDFCLIEVGGTVGDMEGLPFYEALRQLRNDLPQNQTCSIHLSLIPWIASAQELKTKPTQHSVEKLRSIGIQPDILLCRCDRNIPEADRNKIALFCNVRPEAVIEALDVKNIYQVPSHYHRQNLSEQIFKVFQIIPEIKVDMTKWDKLAQDCIQAHETTITLAIVGKYGGCKDTYKSLVEALTHSCFQTKINVDIRWIESENLEFDRNSNNFHESVASHFKGCNAIIVPGGFGVRGTTGKINAIEYARLNKIPFLGICLGMQLAIIEHARHKCNMIKANSTEFGPTEFPIITTMTEWIGESLDTDVKKRLKAYQGQIGGTMRLGDFKTELKTSSLIQDCYQQKTIIERHRHRYKFNLEYKNILEKDGYFKFTGFSKDGLLCESVEICKKIHPFFIGVQYHPELISRPFKAHPLFSRLLEEAKLNLQIGD